MAALKLTKVRKAFGDHVAVKDVSLEVPAGGIYGFIGPNGAGKTTTLRMIVDIIKPDAGQIEVLGTSDPPTIRERIGYLPEERGMYKKMRCLDFVAYIGALKGMPLGDARRSGEELIEKFELGKWKHATVDALSKGMQQKLQFVSTIVHQPELLILDEPFSGLDPVNLEVIKDQMLAFRRAGRTVIFSTHMMDHADRLCDSMLMIHRGEKVLDGSMRAIKADAPERPVRLNCYGDTAFIADLPYVTRVRGYGNDLEIFIAEGTAPQTLLRDLVERVTITRYDISEPSLYDIFLEQVSEGRRHKIAENGNLVPEDRDRAVSEENA